MMVMMHAEIAKNEEASESKPSPPERVRDPVVKICIVPGWRIISHNRRSIFIIIFIDGPGSLVVLALRRRRCEIRLIFSRSARLVFRT
jgi:hypothetical protein